MKPRWRSLVAVVVLGAPACAIHQLQTVTVVVQQPQLQLAERPSPLESISLGEGPGDLTAAQINAALDGQGTWFDSPVYGRIWHPDERLISGGFFPYGSGGQWVATGAGWYWQSDYAWGQVAFHYGRWVLDGSQWWWVPGSQFAPAWVDWRRGNGWTGWAALAPVGARTWPPFTYCNHGALAGTGLVNRVVRGAAASSLFARTSPLASPDGTPRGPELQHPVALASIWNVPPPAAQPASPFALGGGIVAVPRIPVALVTDEPTAIADALPAAASSGGPTVVIRDRDLIGMSEGPSVRRPAGELVLPELVNTPRPNQVVVIAPPRLASAAPPPLPPAPDGQRNFGLPMGGYYNSYPGRAAGFYGQRHTGAPQGQTLIVAPSQPAVAAAPSPQQQYSRGYVGGFATGLGGRSPAHLSGPTGRLQ